MTQRALAKHNQLQKWDWKTVKLIDWLTVSLSEWVLLWTLTLPCPLPKYRYVGYASASTHTLKYIYQGSLQNCVCALSREVIQASSRLLKVFWTTRKKRNHTWMTFHRWTSQEKERRKKGKERWINFDLTLVEVGEVVWRLWGKSNGIRQLPEAYIWSCAPTQWISALPITVCVLVRIPAVLSITVCLEH